MIARNSYERRVTRRRHETGTTYDKKQHDKRYDHILDDNDNDNDNACVSNAGVDEESRAGHELGDKRLARGYQVRRLLLNGDDDADKTRG